MNVYLVRDGDGVLVFDGGIKAMTRAVAAAGARMGGITRLVLGHEHPDHRGIAPKLGVPVYCHPDGKEDAEGDGGEHYFDMSKLKPLTRARHAADAEAVGRRAGADRGHRRRGRRHRGLRGRSTCPATRPARSGCGASPTASRS